MSALRRILFVTHNYPPIPGGITSFAVGITRALAHCGINVRVLAPVPGLEPLPENVTLRSFHEGPCGKFRRAAIIPALHRELKAKPDLVFLASLHPYGMFVQKLCAWHKIPYVLTTHGLEILRLLHGHNWLGIEKWAARISLSHARAVIANSHFTAQLDRRFIGHSLPLHVIPMGLNGEEFIPEKKARDKLSLRIGQDCSKAFLLLSVSRLVERKGHIQVLKALRMLSGKYPDLAYLIVGEGPERSKLEAEVVSLGLSRSVFFLGPLAFEDLLYVYQCSDLFALTSRHLLAGDVEGFGIVYLEANACGLPVIAGNTGGVPDAVKDGETGLLVDPEKPGEIAAAIERLINDADLRRRMGEIGRRWAEEHDWSRLVRRYLEVLERIRA